MMKKLLLPLMMMLATIAVAPGNSNEAVKASAEETKGDVTNKTKNVEKGYITNNLLDKSKGYINFTDSIQTKFNDNFSKVSAKKKSYDDSLFKSAFIPYWGTQSAHRSDGYIIRSDYDNTKWQNTSYLLKNSSQGLSKATLERFVYTKYGLDYCFEDWDKDKEQPLELAIDINLKEIETGILCCYPFVQFPDAESIEAPTEDFENTFPIISINGYDYFNATFSWKAEDNSYTIKYSSNNSRAYVTYNGVEYANYVFLEIPFTNYVQTIDVATYIKVENGQPQKNPILSRSVYLLNDAKNSSFKAPIVIKDIDFNRGLITTITSNSVYLDSDNNATINAVDTEFIRLDSIVIDDSLTLYVSSTGEHPSESEEVYALYTDTTRKTKFNYSSNTEFARKLQAAQDNVEFKVTKYNYSILKKANEEDEDYATTTDFVNCGNYYGFKKISKEQIHIAVFDCITAKNSFYSRLAFNVYDQTAQVMLEKLNALMFTYTFKNESMSLSITGKDVADSIGGEMSNWMYLSPLTTIIKTVGDKKNTFYATDKYNNKFGLHGMKSTDYVCFNWKGYEDLKKTNKSNMFLLYTESNVVFDSLVSAVYVDKVGDIINCSTIFPNGVEAPTAIINDDGSVSIKDVHGKIIKGTVNKDGFFVDEKGNKWDYPDNVPDPTNPWDDFLKSFKKIVSAATTIAIIAGVALLISKVGPTLVMIFKKKE